MELKPARARLYLLDERCRQASVAFTKEAEVHGNRIGSLEHPFDVPRPWGAGGCIGSGGRSRTAAQHGRDARIECLFDLLRTDVVNMGVDAAGSDDLAFRGDDLASRANDDIDVRL